MTVRMVQDVVQWLQNGPLIDDHITVDHLENIPGSAGLFPLGMEEISRREDVTGAVVRRCRYRFELRRVTGGQKDNSRQAQWLVDFQDWVKQQEDMGMTPTFGDEPAQEHIRAEKGRLKSAAQTGTGTYTVELIAEFVLKGEM